MTNVKTPGVKYALNKPKIPFNDRTGIRHGRCVVSNLKTIKNINKQITIFIWYFRLDLSWSEYLNKFSVGECKGPRWKKVELP